jgi:hypothetical protein
MLPVFLILFVLVGGSFTLIMILSSRKTNIEKGLTPIYTERCGGLFDIMNYTYPFVRLTLYDDFLVISCLTKRIVKYKNIKQIEKTGVFRGGIQIITYNKHDDLPKIWTSNGEFITSLIKERKL